jgi:flagellar hook assembly protein FlgD
MTKEEFANNINTRIQAINPMGQGVNVASEVSTIIAQEADAFVRDLQIEVTIPALSVVDGSTSEVTVTATIL